MQANCDNCHAKFKAETTSSAQFHGGGRVNVGMCNVCHNPARTSNPQANSASFIHRIHNGEQVAPADQFHGIAVTYPQDIRNCDTCHGGAAQGDQSLTNISQLACKGCHDYVAFDNSAPDACGLNGAIVRDADGMPVPCNHVGGPQPDNACATCHGPAGVFATSRYHKPVVRPRSEQRAGRSGGGNNNTNASYVAEANYVPTGANVITYDVKSVDTWTDTTVVPNVKRPPITFKLKMDGVDVVFRHVRATSDRDDAELRRLAERRTSRSRSRRTAIATPTDFNASVERLHQDDLERHRDRLGRGHARPAPTRAATTPSQLTGVQIPPTATMLTGGLGYTYSLSSTPPLVQTNVPDYPWTPERAGRRQGAGRPQRPGAERVEGRDRLHRRAARSSTTPSATSCHGAARRRADVPRRPAQRRPDLLVLPQPEPHELGLGGGLEVLHPRDPRGSQARGAVHVARGLGRRRLRRGRVPGHAERLHHLPRAEHVRLHERRRT